MTNYNRQMFTISDFGFSRFRIWDFGLWILKKEKSLILTLEPYVLHPKSFCPIKNKNIILSQIPNPKSLSLFFQFFANTVQDPVNEGPGFFGTEFFPDIDSLVNGHFGGNIITVNQFKSRNAHHITVHA